MVVGILSFVVVALGSKAAADSHTKPKTEQATDVEKKMMPKPDAKPEMDMGTVTQKQGEDAGHEGSHTDEEKNEKCY